MSGEIIVVPIGEVKAHVLAHLCAAITETFGRRSLIGGKRLAPDYAFNPRRAQHAASALLQELYPGPAQHALGVADLDLYVPELNFVFGLADFGGRRAVIALPRLRESFYGVPDDEALFLARAAKEAVHELGHTYGLKHCHDRTCAMAFSNSLADTDYKERAFCERCRSLVKREV